MIIERHLKLKYNFQMKGMHGTIITFLLVMFCWLIFRSPSISFAWHYFKLMFTNSATAGLYKYSYYVPFKTIAFAVAGFMASFIDFKKYRFFGNTIFRCCASFLMLIAALAFMSDASFSPFIYFQF